MLLSGSGKASDAFTAGPMQKRGDFTWCTLLPKQRDSDFERVSLAFNAKGELAAMELVDKLGQSTLIGFGNLVRNGKVDESAFRFVPPKGADVIGNAAPGALYYMHTSRQIDVDALPLLLKGFQDAGYKLVTAGEILTPSEVAP